MHGSPTIGLGEEVNGFPVIWVGTNDGWYGGVDLNITLALRKALQQALMKDNTLRLPTWCKRRKFRPFYWKKRYHSALLSPLVMRRDSPRFCIPLYKS